LCLPTATVHSTNHCNIARRGDDPLVDLTAGQGIAFVPYLPLGGFSPLQSDTVRAVAQGLRVTPMAVALAWLLQRSPNILLIPGTSSVAHLRDNVASAGLKLPADAVAALDAIGGRGPRGWSAVPPDEVAPPLLVSMRGGSLV
jgi:aryl-alcohol dehydrogenase-like predicted oxidoreductase